MNPALNDPKVKQAIRLLKAKGVTIREIEIYYKHFDEIKRRTESNNTTSLGSLGIS